VRYDEAPEISNKGGKGASFGGGGGGGGGSNSVYVGNLTYETSWQDLKDHMRQAGDVIHAEIFTFEGKGKGGKGNKGGKSKGCGLVEYGHPKDATRAIRTLTDTELDGRLIFVREDRE